MGATEIISDCRWKHHLKGRKRNYSLFKIPPRFVRAWQIQDQTKRKVRIHLSDGRSLTGYCTVTSGEEFRMPVWLQKELRSQEWFELEILGFDSASTGGLRWETNGHG